MLTYEASPLFRLMAAAAVRNERLTKFPARVMLAASACESRWWEKVTGDFNYWGIIRHPSDGPARWCRTSEAITPKQLLSFSPQEQASAIKEIDLGGGRFLYSMSRWFASYASLDESVQAYTEFFTKSPHRYTAGWHQFLADGNEDALLKHICEAGYATSPAAEKTELSILHQQNIIHAYEMALAGPHMDGDVINA